MLWSKIRGLLSSFFSLYNNHVEPKSTDSVNRPLPPLGLDGITWLATTSFPPIQSAMTGRRDEILSGLYSWDQDMIYEDDS